MFRLQQTEKKEIDSVVAVLMIYSITPPPFFLLFITCPIPAVTVVITKRLGFAGGGGRRREDIHDFKGQLFFLNF